jgi:hypothetical protein
MRTKEMKVSLHLVGDYNAEAGSYTVRCAPYGDLSIPVSVDDAAAFKSSFASIKHHEKYMLNGHQPVLVELMITTPDGKNYIYKQQNLLDNMALNVDYRFDLLDYNAPQPYASNKQSGVASAFAGEQSDVDVNIPFVRPNKKNTFVLAIGNEDYIKFQSGLHVEQNAKFARNDAEIFARYAAQTLGVPRENVTLLIDVTESQLRRAIERLGKCAEAFSGRAELIFYYAGHGLSHPQTAAPYLLPVDVSGANVDNGIRLAEVYQMLTVYKAKSVTVLLDTDFAGSGRSMALSAASWAKTSPKFDNVLERVVTLAASQNSQSAGIYAEQQHGLFTYYMLKKIQQTQGAITLGELMDYLAVAVSQAATRMRHEQTPVVRAGGGAAAWESWTF